MVDLINEKFSVQTALSRPEKIEAELPTGHGVNRAIHAHKKTPNQSGFFIAWNQALRAIN
ncbi:hypothetical protein [Pseudomonas grimontii]|uniref:hypothetical protein n=1 Tax=Pseudomonas grimontii TaxID=129847 RepID=UPI00387B2A64